MACARFRLLHFIFEFIDSINHLINWLRNDNAIIKSFIDELIIKQRNFKLQFNDNMAARAKVRATSRRDYTFFVQLTETAPENPQHRNTNPHYE